MSTCEKELKRTVLYNKHLESNARMVPFSGWCMPVQYEGIIAEHMHTRRKAGLFDICHMGEFFLRGAGSRKDLERLVTLRVDNLEVGRCRYGFLLNNSGGVIDDLIVFRTKKEEYLLVVNASRIEADKEWINKNISANTIFADETLNTAKIDLQGPLSGEVLGRVIGKDTAEGIKRFAFIEEEIEGEEVLISRTGYTGELGFELFFPASAADKMWDLFLSFDEVSPVGLGARDTLRMEKGLSLYGNDIDEDHTPLEANLARFVHMDKDFIGKDALLAKKPEKILTGFICEGRRSARSHYHVIIDGREVGEVTSGAFSPVLKKGIGFCYIEKGFASTGQKVTLTCGKAEIEATIKSLPII